MTVVVLGIDALDPDLVEPGAHPNLVLEAHDRIETIQSATGEPSTHELWPTIITGLSPDEHGITLEEGVAWESPILSFGSTVGQFVLPDGVRTRIGAWLLNNTGQDQFRLPSSYYERNGLETVFDAAPSTAIGIPNYVTDPDSEDREHQLRRQLGDLFERDAEATGGHRSADPATFYEHCLEMAMVRVARVRRAVRSQRYGLVFGYTSALDLIGHIAHDVPGMQETAYGEFDDTVGDLVDDIGDDDDLLLVSDHGLQDGLHTDEAMVASTNPALVDAIDDVRDVRATIEQALAAGDHTPAGRRFERRASASQADAVKESLEDLGYL